MFSSIKSFVSNMTVWNWVTIAVLFLAGTFSTGCLRSFIKVDTPQPIVDAYGFPEEIPLDEVDIAQESYLASVTNNMTVWNSNEALADSKAAFWEDFVAHITSPETLVEFGINPAGGGAASLIYVLGLLKRKPGDVSPNEYRKGKEESYNAGIEVGKNLVVPVKSEA